MGSNDGMHGQWRLTLWRRCGAPVNSQLCGEGQVHGFVVAEIVRPEPEVVAHRLLQKAATDNSQWLPLPSTCASRCVLLVPRGQPRLCLLAFWLLWKRREHSSAARPCVVDLPLSKSPGRSVWSADPTGDYFINSTTVVMIIYCSSLFFSHESNRVLGCGSTSSWIIPLGNVPLASLRVRSPFSVSLQLC
jgi:hypothetical protein